jgi:hypothetical protein
LLLNEWISVCPISTLIGDESVISDLFNLFLSENQSQRKLLLSQVRCCCCCCYCYFLYIYIYIYIFIHIHGYIFFFNCLGDQHILCSFFLFQFSEISFLCPFSVYCLHWIRSFRFEFFRSHFCALHFLHHRGRTFPLR